jgi:hypothetical protein
MLEQKRRTDVDLCLKIDVNGSGSCILAFSEPKGDTYRTKNNVQRTRSRQTKRPHPGPSLAPVRAGFTKLVPLHDRPCGRCYMPAG